MIDEMKIAELAAASFEADQAYRAMGALNANRPYDEARQLAIDYAIAAARAAEAKRALDSAVDGGSEHG
jgi:hypothetical protein